MTIKQNISQCHHHLNLNKIQELLEQHRISKTPLKIKILKILSRGHRPYSVLDIHRRMGKKACNLSTIFRSINQFKLKNIVQEIDLQEGFYRYELRDEKITSNHHHHIRCRKCGKINSFSGCELSHFYKMISHMGYKEIEHQLEFSGLCRRCPNVS